MTSIEVRVLALSVIVRVVLEVLERRPALRRQICLAALDAAHPMDSVPVMREICRALKQEG